MLQPQYTPVFQSMLNTIPTTAILEQLGVEITTEVFIQSISEENLQKILYMCGMESQTHQQNQEELRCILEHGTNTQGESIYFTSDAELDAQVNHIQLMLRQKDLEMVKQGLALWDNLTTNKEICLRYLSKIEPLNLDHFSNMTEFWTFRNQITCSKKHHKDYIALWILGKLAEFGIISQINILNIPQENLTELPDNIGYLHNLIELDISGNQLSSLPEDIGRLINLQKLNIRWNFLTMLPQSFENLINLRDLNLNCNELREFPEFLQSLTHLTTLGLNRNYLHEIPQWLERLSKLTYLDIGTNSFSDIPEWFGNLSTLEHLVLTSIGPLSVPNSLSTLTQLKSLHVSNLTNIPEWFKDFTQLTSLELSRMNLQSIPEYLENYTQLQSLNICNNQLRKLPQWLIEAPQLTTLYLGENLFDDHYIEQLQMAMPQCKNNDFDMYLGIPF